MSADASHPDTDTTRPHPARVYDWLLGGSSNHPVDRKVGEALPGETRGNAARNRAFMHRATAWLARNGIAQFLDIGTGIPTEPNLHQIVQAVRPDDEDPYAVVRSLVGALPAGSFLVLSHGTTDQHPEWGRSIESAYEKGAIPLRLRTRSEVEPFFEGLELVAPGLVSATEWYREGPAPTPERSGFHVGVARIP
ncbi:SAM-dependent methyltransferase [Streptomyces sp. MMBL 11-3]|uniref:SAM-dependent methyltransferase n=1 Tax=Streptomyces sp. MMBL 11-3 TaxID=3382639 RepID=UPI0039B3DD55